MLLLLPVLDPLSFFISLMMCGMSGLGMVWTVPKWAGTGIVPQAGTVTFGLLDEVKTMMSKPLVCLQSGEKVVCARCDRSFPQSGQHVAPSFFVLGYAKYIVCPMGRA